MTPEQYAQHQARVQSQRSRIRQDESLPRVIGNDASVVNTDQRSGPPATPPTGSLRPAVPAAPTEFVPRTWKEREAVTITCADCSTQLVRSSPGQRYCPPCSEIRDRARKTKWARENPKPITPKRREAMDAANAEARERGRQFQASLPGTFGCSEEPDLAWLVRIAVPFSYAASKNSIYSLRAGGHVFLRKQGRAMRTDITRALKEALRNHAVVQNRIWIDIFVEKPDHRGDAINVVDMVADAIKDACGVDDRWFSIRRLDWRIKRDGMLYVGLGQERVEASQACSYCGQIQPFSAFSKNKYGKNGIGRVCVDCRRNPPPEAA